MLLLPLLLHSLLQWQEAVRYFTSALKCFTELTCNILPLLLFAPAVAGGSTALHISAEVHA
jgi:hypothetical protein